ncbi:Ribosomal S8 protein [Rutstroemia sp. NJR-2017a BVV2]|nr:Ribosomal S8 protein [Rutstroemia sp. NJR-2017a BVV2]
MVDDWSNLLPDADRTAFLEACIGAGQDDGSLQTVLSRYFSTWKTSLMAEDLIKLQTLATCEQIGDCVRVICVEDDFESLYYEDDGQLACEQGDIRPERTLPSRSSVIWPRHEDGQVAAEALGVGLLKSMFATKQLRPDRIEIRDKRTQLEPSDPETAALFARNILDGADLAIKAFSVRTEWGTTTIIVAELSPEHQGQGTGLSILHSAQLCLRRRRKLDSYWANQIFFHALALKELSLSFWQPPRGIVYMGEPLIMEHPSLLKLEKLDISGARLSMQNVMAILGKSEQSLKGISFRVTTLVTDSTWRELLTRIANGFPQLTWFRIGSVGQGPIGQFQVTFRGLENESVVGKPYRSGLRLVQRGPVDNRRIPGVEYEGPHANHVLRIVAEHAVPV